MTLPSVTALCPSYGRTRLLEESIESFFRQDYGGEKRMIILNDLPDQTLEIDHPLIRVVNLPERCSNLGNKRNLVASYAETDLIITWSDDDIHLPNRISENVKLHHRGFYVAEGCHYFYNPPKIHLKNGMLSGPFLMSLSDYMDLGGIPDADSGEDQLFFAKVSKSLTVVKTNVPSYIYRWNTGHYHISGLGRNNGEWNKVSKIVEASMLSGKEPSGIVRLEPRWSLDFETIANGAIDERKSAA